MEDLQSGNQTTNDKQARDMGVLVMRPVLRVM